MNEQSVDEVASWLHYVYQYAAKDYGWKTQKSTQCDWDNVPEEYERVLWEVATRIIERFCPKKPCGHPGTCKCSS